MLFKIGYTVVLICLSHLLYAAPAFEITPDHLPTQVVVDSDNIFSVILKNNTNTELSQLVVQQFPANGFRTLSSPCTSAPLAPNARCTLTLALKAPATPGILFKEGNFQICFKNTGACHFSSFTPGWDLEIIAKPPVILPPTLNHLSPIAGPANAQSASLPSPILTVTGNHFKPGLSIRLGSLEPIVCMQTGTACTYIDEAHLSVTPPVSTQGGTVDVTVTNPDGQFATLPSSYTYVELQGIVSFREMQAASTPITPSPTSGNGPTQGGTGVTLTGHFPPQNTPITVTFGDAPATLVTIDSPTTITANTPASTANEKKNVSIFLVDPNTQHKTLLAILNNGYEYRPMRCKTQSEDPSSNAEKCAIQIRACLYVPPNTVAATQIVEVKGRLVTNSTIQMPQCVDAIPKFGHITLPNEASDKPRLFCTDDSYPWIADRQTGSCAEADTNTGTPNLSLLSLHYTDANQKNPEQDTALLFLSSRDSRFFMIAPPSESFDFGQGPERSMQLSREGYVPQYNSPGFCQFYDPMTFTLPAPTGAPNYCLNKGLPYDGLDTYPWMLVSLYHNQAVSVVDSMSHLI